MQKKSALIKLQSQDGYKDYKNGGFIYLVIYLTVVDHIQTWQADSS